ncbi:MAG TPA: DUF58 domain-containing protein [Planctomycetota bacterium]|nr:DUF58 domain-containing protein [Planctomycetota bacterium]
MIAPRPKLLLWTALAVVPLATFAVLATDLGLIFSALLTVVLFIMTCDAVLAYKGLAGISVKVPPVVRLSKERQGEILFEIANTTGLSREVRLGLALPRAIWSAQEEMTVALPAGAEHSRVGWPCTPLRRGRYVIDRCYLEGISPLGLWNTRAVEPVSAELRVYPNLAAERRSAAAVFLNRGGAGTRAQRMVGQGRDFEKLRDYIHGDSLDEIHWKATAKRRHPVSKVFQVERTQEVYVIIDTSRLSGRLLPLRDGNDGPDAELKSTTVLERLITAALVVGMAAEKQGDLFGVLTFGDRMEKFLRAKRGKEHFNLCRDSLYTVQPRAVTPDYGDLCSFIRVRLRRRALLLFLTSLDDPMLAESFTQNIKLICRQHLVLVNMLKPAGLEPVFSTPVAHRDEIYQRLSGHLLWNSLRELKNVLHRSGVSFSLLEDATLTADLISKYMAVKQRQLL